jgi:hypothetical protein
MASPMETKLGPLFVIFFLSPEKVFITRTNDKATKAHLAETDLYSYRKSP